MARGRRDEDPDAIYHVTSRGNDRQAIFRDEFDRRGFLGKLDRAALKYRWVGLAYCLMTNHYHLVLRAPFGGLSRGMQELNGGYSRRTNSRNGRSGHLFQNRFHSTKIARDAHLLESCRYVVLNPVRARICSRPEDWRWSSYRACAGLDLAPLFLAADHLLGLFGSNAAAARRAYVAFVAAGRVQVSDKGREV